jgi:hypothetical protein
MIVGSPETICKIEREGFSCLREVRRHLSLEVGGLIVENPSTYVIVGQAMLSLAAEGLPLDLKGARDWNTHLRISHIKL